MLIAHSMPTSAVAIAGGNWLTADGGAACVDGQPGRVARYQAAVAPMVTLTLATAQVTGLVAVLGIKGAAIGAPISVTTGGVTVAGVLRRMFGGTLGCFLLVDGAAADARVAYTLPAGTIDVGELVAMQVVHTGHESDWSIDVIDPTQSTRNRGSGTSSTRAVPYRRFEGALEVVGKAMARQGGMPGGLDMQQLGERLLGDQRCIFVVRFGADGIVDQDELNATAIYGVARISRSQHAGGDWYRSSSWIEEVPAY